MKQILWLEFLQNMRPRGHIDHHMWTNPDGVPVIELDAVFKTIDSIEEVADEIEPFYIDPALVSSVEPFITSDNPLISIPFESIWMECPDGFPEFKLEPYADPKKPERAGDLIHTYKPVGMLIGEREQNHNQYFFTLYADVFPSGPMIERSKTRASGEKVDPRPGPMGLPYRTRAVGIVDRENFQSGGLPQYAYSIATQVFDKFRSKTVMGSEKANERLRIGTGEKRRQIKIKNIVHVTLKARQEQYRSPTSRPVDWSHRWEVMGHWRKISGIGKDRIGNYVVVGSTWVVPHTKGPDEKPMVKKLRYVRTPVSVTEMVNP